MNVNREMLAFLRKQYPVGTRIRLDSMQDPYAPVEAGTTGKLDYIDCLLYTSKYKATAYIRLSYTDDHSSESDSVSNQRKLIEMCIRDRLCTGRAWGCSCGTAPA